jgi:antitoxin component YwqK of YwqJK toxin-antitoxin module
MTTENYKDGKLEGLRSVFYPSGKIAEETSYKQNLKRGVYKNTLKME